MWGYQPHDRPVLDTLIQPSETSSSNYQRLSWRSRETRVKNGRWILPTSTLRARRVLLHFVNLRHGIDGYTSPPKEGVLRLLSPLKSIVLGRVWTREPWVQWQARYPLHHRGRMYNIRDQTACLAYVTSLWVDGKQIRILCDSKILRAQELGQQAIKYCRW
jgi:hypothetical protein